MKIIFRPFIKFLLLLTVVFIAVQCNEDESSLATGGDILIRDSLPTIGVYDAEISNLTVASGTRKLELSWTAPEKPVAFYLVEWRGVDADQTLYSVPVTGSTKYMIEHLYNTTYQVTVRTVSDDFLKSNGVSKTATPQIDLIPPGNVTGTKISALASSALLEWTNPNDDDFDRIYVEVQEDGVDTNLIELNLLNIDNQLKATGLKENTLYVYRVQTFDYIGNASQVLSASFKTKREAYLDRTGWEVIDFSTQEVAGEGANNGRAWMVLDNDDATFWHSKWYGGSDPMPHTLTIDIKSVQMPSVVEIYKRNTATKAQNLIKIEGCLEEPTTKTEWINLGTHSIDPTPTTAQSCYITTLAEVRYLKISVMASNNNHVMIREIKVKGLVD